MIFDHPSACSAVPYPPLWLGVTYVTLVLQATNIQLLQNPQAFYKALAPITHRWRRKWTDPPYLKNVTIYFCREPASFQGCNFWCHTINGVFVCTVGCDCAPQV